ncbi:hypothetical protein LUCX_36 [Xanthomonas phage vB_XciM_LucasX]|nr:hypothetical protein LUCX_36 [Xanthomonas phage vB_XciM_LucasX]
MTSTRSPGARRVDVFATVSMEAQMRALNLNADLRFASDSVSLETQQMEEQRQLNQLADHHEQLKKLLKGEKPTGTPHLFVLEPELLKAGGQEAQSVLQALAQSQFNCNQSTVVALLPPSAERSQAGELVAQTLKDGILKDLGLEAIETYEGLQKHFGTFISPEIREIPSMEAQINEDFVTEQVKERKVSTTPFSQDDIDFIEEHMGQKLPADLKKLYLQVGSFRVDGLTVYSAHSAMTETSAMMQSNRHLPYTYFVFGRKVFNTNIDRIKAGDEFKLICDLKTRKVGYLPSAGGVVARPSSALYPFIASLIHFND